MLQCVPLDTSPRHLKRQDQQSMSVQPLRRHQVWYSQDQHQDEQPGVKRLLLHNPVSPVCSCLKCTPQGLLWWLGLKSLREDTSSFSTPNTPPRLLELQLTQQTWAYQPEPFFWDSPFWEHTQLTLWRHLVRTALIQIITQTQLLQPSVICRWYFYNLLLVL